MKKPVRRSAEEILLDINSKAKLYTPEWHPIADQPDLGAALSEVFARMQSDTEKKYEKLTEKYCTDYFNCLEADVKPASPAEGYVVFKMPDTDVPTQSLLTGTVLVSDASDDEGEPVQAELTEDIMVVPNTVQAIIETEGRSDYVGIIKDASKIEEDEEKKGFIFMGGEPENIQSHQFFLAHPCLYPLGKSGVIDVSFIYRDGEFLSQELLRDFADPQVCTVFYEYQDGRKPLKNVVATDHCIRINIEQDVSDWAETEKGGYTSRWLGFEVHKTFNMENFGFEDVFVRSECMLEKPDQVFSENSSEQDGVYLPFGERFSLYDDLYFACNDALSKKGAEIELSFSQEFRAFPLMESDANKKTTNWKLIMDVNDFKIDRVYDISIEEVIWEYYNGNGWAKLFAGKKYADTFSINNGTARRLVSMSFICPDDITSIVVDSAEGYFIRARIRKINNEYKTSGQFVAPLIYDVCFGYHYNEKQERPSRLFAVNNVYSTLYRDIGKPGNIIAPVEFPEEKERCLYFGTNSKLVAGPIKILFVLDKRMEEEQPKFVLEYYGRDGNWKPIKAIDETFSMKTTGIITLTGLSDSKRKNIYGYDMYWIRIRKLFPDKKSRVMPIIKDIFINAAKARTLRTDRSESFTLEQYAPERRIQLKNRNIQDLEVWILEDSGVTAEQRKALIEAGRYRTHEDEFGETIAYVKWQETDNSLDLDSRDQLYMLDAGKGELTFGKGSAGLLPAPGIPDAIIATYSFGGGNICNLRAGSITGLDLSKGFISEVTNPMEFSGGFDRENKEDALYRAKKEQKHNFHAITIDDYEALAFEASRNISKVKCFAGINHEGQKAPGNVTLVILIKDYNNQKSFDEQRHEIMEYFKDKLPVGIRPDRNFRIREPELVQINIDIDAEIEDYHATLPIMRTMQDRLDAFLDPISGGFSGKGWTIGNIPESGQLETVIRSVPGVVLLKKCKLSAKIINSPGALAEDIAKVQERQFILPARGEYKITLVEQKLRR